MIGGIAGLGPSFLARPTPGFETRPTGVAATAGPAGSFAQALAGLANNTVDTLRSAESVSFEALQGRGDTRAVVDAVLSAEQSLQTAVAIRDKIVSAYLDISRMAI